MLKSLLHNALRTPSILMVGALFMASCGSYQQASYYDDGIYSNNNRVVGVEKRNAEAVRIEEQENNIYGDYFGEKANEYGEILESEIFTDIDSYSSQMANDTIPYGEQTDYFAYNNNYNGNPGWGDNPSSVSINIYDNSWGWGGYYGWNAPYFAWGWGYNYPYYNWTWGWYNPWRYNRWGWAGYYGWGGYYGRYWNRPYYNRGPYIRGYAYMSGRRGYNSRIPGTTLSSRTNAYSSRVRSNSGRSNAIVSRNKTLANRSSKGYSSTSAVRRSISADAVARNQNYRTSRSTRTSPGYSRSSGTYRSYGTSPSTRSSRSYNRSSVPSSRSYQSRSTTPSRNYSRSSSSSSTRSYRSSSSSRSSKSSGSYRSSSSSSRSSGVSRSSGSSGSSRSSGASRSSGSRGGRP